MACLVVVEGPKKGHSFALQDHQLVLVGRDDECTFQILDARISRRHMQIKRGDDGRHSVIDFHSSNGLSVNGQSIHEDRVLEEGDQIEIGGSIILYSTADVADAERAVDAWHKQGEWQNETMVRRPDEN